MHLAEIKNELSELSSVLQRSNAKSQNTKEQQNEETELK